MKNSLLILILPILFQCSENNGVFGERQKITLNITLDENSPNYLVDPGQLSYSNSAALDLTGGERIDNVATHNIGVKVLNYTCSAPQVFSMLSTTYYVSSGIATDVFHFYAESDYSGNVPYKAFLNRMKNELITEQITDIKYQATLSEEITDF